MVKRKFEDALDYIQPTKFIVHSDQYSNEYKTPVLTAGNSFVLGYTDEFDGIYAASKEKPIILFDDFTTAVQWVDFNFKVKSSACKILVPKNGYILKYLFYAMKSLNFDNSQHKRYWISEYSQRLFNDHGTKNSEIVKELDAIHKALEIEKERLLSLDELIKSRFIEMFGDPAINPFRYPKLPLGDIAFITKLAGFEYTQYIKYKDAGPITMVRGLNCKKGKLILDDVYYENKETSDLLPRSKLYKGDIVLTYVGTIAECALIDKDDKYHLAPNVAKVSILEKDKNIPEFFTALFVCFRDYIVGFATATSQPKISMGEIRKIPFIVPPTNKQIEFAEFVKQVDKSKFVVHSRYFLCDILTLFSSTMA